jgi:hypothetical protein
MKSLTVANVEPKDIVKFIRESPDRWLVHADGNLRRASDGCCPLEAYFHLGAGGLNETQMLFLLSKGNDPLRIMLGPQTGRVIQASDRLPLDCDLPSLTALSRQLRAAADRANQMRNRQDAMDRKKLDRAEGRELRPRGLPRAR